MDINYSYLINAKGYYKTLGNDKINAHRPIRPILKTLSSE